MFIALEIPGEGTKLVNLAGVTLIQRNPEKIGFVDFIMDSGLVMTARLDFAKIQAEVLQTAPLSLAGMIARDKHGPLPA